MNEKSKDLTLSRVEFCPTRSINTFERKIKNGLFCSQRAQIMENCLLFNFNVQWILSCEATPFAPGKWPFKRGGLSSGVEINTLLFRFTSSSGLFRGVMAPRQVGLSKGVTLYCQFLTIFFNKANILGLFITQVCTYMFFMISILNM